MFWDSEKVSSDQDSLEVQAQTKLKDQGLSTTSFLPSLVSCNFSLSSTYKYVQIFYILKNPLALVPLFSFNLALFFFKT